MAILFCEAAILRKEDAAAQADFVKAKLEADKVHRTYIALVSAMRDLDRVLTALSPHEDGARAPIVSQSARAAADEIFDKFRRGEKLTTEDLMALQKAGRL